MKTNHFLFLLLLAACRTPGDSKPDTASPEADEDGDGWAASEDCDDTDPEVNPGEIEVCDGVDNDCDGTADENVTTNWYADADADGYGDPSTVRQACEKPEGYVPNGNDCDDTEAAAWPGNLEVCDGVDNDCDGTVDEDVAGTWYADSDGDGYGDPAAEVVACAAPAGAVPDATDCDDGDATVHPDATETCDGRDEDCDGVVDDGAITTWYADSDGDGHGNAALAAEACEAPRGYVASGDDCDDTDAGTFPGATETCDGEDDDCDGTIDEGATRTLYQDADGDGYGDATVTSTGCRDTFGWAEVPGDCDDYDDSVNPAAVEICDDTDNDCDGLTDEADATDARTWYRDADADGHGDPTRAETACDAPAGYVSLGDDCDDAEALSNPALPELCDGVDNDCDGVVDEAGALDEGTWYQDADGDGFGDAAAPTAACTAPAGFVANDDDCDDAEPTALPGGTEVCDGVDNDCDGSVDEGATDLRTWYADVDGDGWGGSRFTTTSCTSVDGYVDTDTDCDDGDASVNPGAVEACDGEDDDCDGAVDEPDAVDAATWYADVDGDGFGDPAASTRACAAPSGTVADASDCDDTNATAFPGAPEVCDGEDDDCDGAVDEGVTPTWYADADGDGFGNAGAPLAACSAPSGTVADASDCDDANATAFPGASEVCDGEDDDCDGAVDEGVTPTWYTDADGDGFGDAGSPVSACTAPSGTVTNASDCDDDDPVAYPSAPESCNGRDDDCDGTVDEGVTPTWYRDADGDGYGNAASPASACWCPTGWVADASDCNDGDATRYPGSPSWVDGADADCDGQTEWIVQLATTADDAFEAWLDDGTYMSGGGWGTTNSFAWWAKSGTHVLALHAWDTGRAIVGWIGILSGGGSSWVTGYAPVSCVTSAPSGSWNAVLYDDTGWSSPTTVPTATASSYWHGLPTDLNAAGALWIWCGDYLGLQPAYFRLEYTLP